ncbi:MAG: hypothetical protein IKX40_07710 [Thermoguttaceae bacterium]|nr:hypothetical protein [Thermoguttaceae bacterium]
MKELAIVNEQLAIGASDTLNSSEGRRPRRPQASSPANGNGIRYSLSAAAENLPWTAPVSGAFASPADNVFRSRKPFRVADEVRRRKFNHKEHKKHKEAIGDSFPKILKNSVTFLKHFR